MARSTSRWGRSRACGAVRGARSELPAPDVLAEARRATGYQLLKVDAAAHTVEVERPGMQLDAGGIAKGYAADAALEVLRASGYGRRWSPREETSPSAIRRRAARDGRSRWKG